MSIVGRKARLRGTRLPRAANLLNRATCRLLKCSYEDHSTVFTRIPSCDLGTCGAAARTVVGATVRVGATFLRKKIRQVPDCLCKLCDWRCVHARHRATFAQSDLADTTLSDRGAPKHLTGNDSNFRLINNTYRRISR